MQLPQEPNLSSRFVKDQPVDAIASAEEVREAVEGLSAAELLKLEKYARYRIRGLGRKASGRTHEDLLRDAMTLSLSGDRRWKKFKISFVTHLLGVVRSISSHWSEKFSANEPFLESELRDPLGKGTSTLLQNVPSHEPTVETVMNAQQKIQQILDRFEKDGEVKQIIQGMAEGLGGNDMQTVFRFTKKQYEAALRRLRRGTAALVD